MEIRRLQNSSDPDNGSLGFNILKFKAPDSTVISLQPMHWVFCVDRSGSMCTLGSKDNKSRLDHVKSTLVRIVEYLYSLCNGTSRNYIIDVVWFNGDILTSHIKIDNNAVIEPFIKEINEVTATGMTNMSAAINKANKIIMQSSAAIKSTLVVLSDGEITAGVSDPNYILEFINECYDKLSQNFTPVFVGYGTEQSSSLLSTLSNTPNGEYHCVESVEGAGIVYGEIVHNTLYECIKDMKIDVFGCQIYDYEKNAWVSSLAVGKIASGANRVWHLRESQDEENSLVGAKASFNIIQIGDTSDNWLYTSVLSGSVIYPESGSIDLECQRYYLRQQVLELLAESKEYTQDRHERIRRNTPPPAPRIRRQRGNQSSSVFDSQISDVDLFEPPPRLSPIRFASDSESVTSEAPSLHPGQVLREKLLSKMKEIKDYMRIVNDGTDMLGSLCDDLYICALALKSNRGLTYILARQTSQGNQRAYNALGVADLEDDQNINHQMSANMVSPYASQQVGEVIRGVSQPLPSHPM